MLLRDTHKQREREQRNVDFLSKCHNTKEKNRFYDIFMINWLTQRSDFIPCISTLNWSNGIMHGNENVLFFVSLDFSFVSKEGGNLKKWNWFSNLINAYLLSGSQELDSHEPTPTKIFTLILNSNERRMPNQWKPSLKLSRFQYSTNPADKSAHTRKRKERKRSRIVHESCKTCTFKKQTSTWISSKSAHACTLNDKNENKPVSRSPRAPVSSTWNFCVSFLFP